MKKGQVSFFIIIGIIMVIVIVLLMFLSKELEFDNVQPEEVEPFVTSCLEQSAESAIKYLSLRGGILDAQESIIVNGREITVLRNGDDIYVPDDDILKSQLEMLTENYLKECVDIGRFHGDITLGSPKVIAEANPNSIIFNLEYPVSVTLGEEVYKKDKFLANIDTRFFYVFSEIRKSVNMIDNGMYNMTHFANMDIDTKAIDTPDAVIFDFKEEDMHAVYAVR